MNMADSSAKQPSRMAAQIENTAEETKAEKCGIDIDDLDLQNSHAAKADDSDGKTDWHWRRTVSLICLAGLYVSSQLPLQFAGGSLTYMSRDLDGTFLSWLITANNLAFAAVCPFAGHMADLLGNFIAVAKRTPYLTISR